MLLSLVLPGLKYDTEKFLCHPCFASLLMGTTDMGLRFVKPHSFLPFILEFCWFFICLKRDKRSPAFLNRSGFSISRCNNEEK